MEKLSISELKSDKKNARRTTARSRQLLKRSLQDLGPARSIVIDETNTVLAGNQTADVARELGYDKVVVVEADGKTVVAVKRTGLTEEEKLRLALYDNRTSELSEWRQDVLQEIAQETFIEDLFTPEDLDEMFGSMTAVHIDLPTVEDDKTFKRQADKSANRMAQSVTVKDIVCPYCKRRFAMKDYEE